MLFKALLLAVVCTVALGGVPWKITIKNKGYGWMRLISVDKDQCWDAQDVKPGKRIERGKERTYKSKERTNGRCRLAGIKRHELEFTLRTGGRSEYRVQVGAKRTHHGEDCIVWIKGAKKAYQHADCQDAERIDVQMTFGKWQDPEIKLRVTKSTPKATEEFQASIEI